MTEATVPTTVTQDESGTEQSLLDTIRSLKKENKELKKQLSEGGIASDEGEQKRNRYGQRCSAGGRGMGGGRGQGRGMMCESRGQGCEGRQHEADSMQHGSCKGGCQKHA
ncbi:MAG: hypothetical protein K6F05_06895 [Succinivibrio sp.]|nr:hypothetical protein [Succinivibrio sp.]